MGNKLQCTGRPPAENLDLLSSLRLAQLGRLRKSYQKKCGVSVASLSDSMFLQISIDCMRRDISNRLFDIFANKSNGANDRQMSFLEMLLSCILVCESHAFSVQEKLDTLMSICQFRDFGFYAPGETKDAAGGGSIVGTGGADSGSKSLESEILLPREHCTRAQLAVMFRSLCSGLLKVSKGSVDIHDDLIIEISDSEILECVDSLLNQSIKKGSSFDWESVKMQLLRSDDLMTFLSLYVDVICLSTAMADAEALGRAADAEV